MFVPNVMTSLSLSKHHTADRTSTIANDRITSSDVFDDIQSCLLRDKANLPTQHSMVALPSCYTSCFFLLTSIHIFLCCFSKQS